MYILTMIKKAYQCYNYFVLIRLIRPIFLYSEMFSVNLIILPHQVPWEYLKNLIQILILLIQNDQHNVWTAAAAVDAGT